MAPEGANTSWRWETLGAVALIEMGQSPPGRLVREGRRDGIPFLQGNAEFGSIFPSHRLVCAKPFKMAEPGDTLISVRAPVGALNVADRPYCIGRGLAGVRFRLNTRFGYHAMAVYSAALRRLAQGSTFEAVGGEHLRGLRFPNPSRAEQARIAEVLDTVDEAIRSTEQVIAKLDQVKRGLLHDLLTRGIDDNGDVRDPVRHPEQFKDSPLGRIPKRWDVAGIASYAGPDRAFLKTGPFGSSLKGEHWVEKGVPVITIGALGEGEFQKSELLYVSDQTAKRLAPYTVQPGDLVFSRVADVGRSVVVEAEQAGWIMSSNLMWISLDQRRADPYFLWLNLSGSASTKSQIRRSVNAGGREVANGTVLRSLRFPWPARVEQAAIVDRVQALRDAERTTSVELEKLRLLKKGLMDDLLTGRIRVHFTKGAA